MMEHRDQEVPVLHDVRFTAQKIARRLVLIAPLVYRHGTPLPDFKYLRLDGPEDAPPVGPEVDTDAWETVAAESMWGAWRTDFVLRTTFTIPADWPSDVPVALYLPLGELGDFSHPEALAYIDGEAYAACDRHHQEILLPARWRDGQPHQLALHGWSGGQREKSPRPWMRTCQVVAIDQPTRDFSCWRAWRWKRLTSWIVTPVRPVTGCSTRWTRPSSCWTRASRWARPSTPASRQPCVSSRRACPGRAAPGRGRHRHRARPHRRGLAVDARPDAAQGRAHLPHRPCA